MRGGILPEPKEYQNQAGRQLGKTQIPTPIIVETEIISTTIPINFVESYLRGFGREVRGFGP